MDVEPTPEPEDKEPGFQRVALLISLVAAGVVGLFWALDWTLALLLGQVVLISIIIWQACDPFADAAQWVGATFRLPGSVRGATLDAVASSMPELFSGIFFVVVAVTAAGLSPEELEAAGAEGFGATVATCAGSAIYNMILIPAFCALFISIYRKDRPTIDVEPEVLSRDGMWFLGCSVVLLIFLYQDAMHWWMALALFGLYGAYVFQLHRDARLYQRARKAIRRHLDSLGPDQPTRRIADILRSEGLPASPALIDEIRYEMLNGGTGWGENNQVGDRANVVFGLFAVRLNHFSVWAVILTATAVAAVACYWLVEITRQTADVLDVPVFFVAVVLAAAASSVPDTFISMMAASRGDDSGAVSNAFGSNIFDICICLAIPLLINAYMIGWQPVYLTIEGEPLPGLLGLRVLLLLLTVITLLIMWHNRQLTRNKAYVLCGLYGVFMAYAVGGALGAAW